MVRIFLFILRTNFTTIFFYYYYSRVKTIARNGNNQREDKER